MAEVDGVCAYRYGKWERKVSYDKSLDAVNTTGSGGAKIYIGGVSGFQVIKISGVSKSIKSENNSTTVDISSDYFGRTTTGGAYAEGEVLIPLVDKKSREAIKKTSKLTITLYDYKNKTISYYFDISENPLDRPHSCMRKN